MKPLRSMNEYRALIDRSVERAERIHLETSVVKTRDQRIIESVVTRGKMIEGVIVGARGYTRFPSNHKVFLTGDSLQAWLYFAEHNQDFIESEQIGNHHEADMFQLSEFLEGALIDGYKERQKMWKELIPRDGIEREVIQISIPPYKQH